MHVADSKSYSYSWEAGQSGWVKPLRMAWLRQSACCSTCVAWVCILLLLRDQRIWSCAFWNHCQFCNKLHWEQGQTQSTWQRRRWVGMYDAAAAAEIYMTCFKDTTIVFLRGLPWFRAALTSSQLTLRAVMCCTISHCILVLLEEIVCIPSR